MSAPQSVVRDERTIAVENAGYKWTAIFTMYALLVDVMYRGLVCEEAAWDLLALAIAPGILCTVYQAYHKTMPGWLAVLMVCCAVAVAASLAAAYYFQLLR